MMYAEIITELQNRGYNVKEVEVNKNGVIKTGIQFKPEGNIAPIIYPESILEDDDNIDVAVKKIIKSYEAHRVPGFNIPFNELTNPEFIVNNLYVGVLRVNKNADYIRRATQFENIDEYLYVRINSEATFKLKKDLADTLGIDIDELFGIAHKNTFKSTTLQSMAEALGIPEDMSFMAPPLYVLRAGESLGAVAMLDTEVLEKFALEHKVNKFAILPSSIHEVLITTHIDDIEELSEMVRAVNGTEVTPEEQLADEAFFYEVA